LRNNSFQNSRGVQVQAGWSQAVNLRNLIRHTRARVPVNRYTGQWRGVRMTPFPDPASRYQGSVAAVTLLTGMTSPVPASGCQRTSGVRFSFRLSMSDPSTQLHGFLSPHAGVTSFSRFTGPVTIQHHATAHIISISLQHCTSRRQPSVEGRVVRSPTLPTGPVPAVFHHQQPRTPGMHHPRIRHPRNCVPIPQ